MLHDDAVARKKEEKKPKKDHTVETFRRTPHALGKALLRVFLFFPGRDRQRRCLDTEEPQPSHGGYDEERREVLLYPTDHAFVLSRLLPSAFHRLAEIFETGGLFLVNGKEE